MAPKLRRAAPGRRIPRPVRGIAANSVPKGCARVRARTSTRRTTMKTKSIRRGVAVAFTAVAAVWTGATAGGPARADAAKIGINVLLRGGVSDAALAELGLHGA